MGKTLEGVSAELTALGFDLSPGQISRLETGYSAISQDRLEQLARIYGWTPSELLAGRSIDDRERVLTRTLPLIDSVQAGAWTETVDPYPVGGAHDMIAVAAPVGRRAFALRIEGESMAPDFRPGDTIVVDPDVPPAPGRYVVAKLGEEERATFKRYRVRGADKRGRPIIELVPLNPDWPTLVIDAANPGRIVGVVIEHYRRLV